MLELAWLADGQDSVSLQWKIFMRWSRARTGHLQKTHALYSSCEGDYYRIGETCSDGPFNIALSEVPHENPNDKGTWYSAQN